MSDYFGHVTRIDHDTVKVRVSHAGEFPVNVSVPLASTDEGGHVASAVATFFRVTGPSLTEPVGQTVLPDGSYVPLYRVTVRGF